MSVLIFDTETSGFPAGHLAFDCPQQCHVMQLAFITLDDDLKEVSCFKSLIRIPDYVEVNDGALAAHGLDKTTVNKFGMNANLPLRLFLHHMDSCDHHVAHNIKFDKRVLDLAFQQNEMHTAFLRSTSAFCTMDLTTDLCKLPKTSNRGPGKYKWPKLEEAWNHLCACDGKTFKDVYDAHDALNDVRACADVFRSLVERGIVNLTTAPVSQP